MHYSGAEHQRSKKGGLIGHSCDISILSKLTIDKYRTQLGGGGPIRPPPLGWGGGGGLLQCQTEQKFATKGGLFIHRLLASQNSITPPYMYRDCSISLLSRAKMLRLTE